MPVDNLQRLKPELTPLDRLAAAKSVAALRAGLQAHYPAFDVRAAQKLAIVGAANEGARLGALCQSLGIEIVAVGDDHPAKIGGDLAGHVVEPVAALERLDRAVPIVIASHRLLGATERARALGFVTVLPFAALQTMAPDLFPAHMFYDGLLDDMWANRDRYRAVNGQLADRRSREVFAAVLDFRQTLDAAKLRPVLDADDLYAPKGLIRFSEREVYVDAGAYDGDTIRTFIDRVGGRFDAVYGFEPDPVTFAKLKVNFRDEPRVRPVHAGLHNHAGILRFRDDASRGAIFTPEGENSIAVTTLDEVLDGGRVTYIKMNIEGAEIDALKGARRSIERWRPKLAISVYHRPSDLWQIPLLANELNESYDFCLRQHDGGIIETVLYAVPRAG